MRLTALVGALWREVWPTLTSSVDAVRVSIITSVRDSSACRSQSRLRHCTTQQTRTTHSAPTPLVETASRAVRQNPCPTQATPTCLVGAATAASKYDVTRLTYFNQDLFLVNKDFHWSDYSIKLQMNSEQNRLYSPNNWTTTEDGQCQTQHLSHVQTGSLETP